MQSSIYQVDVCFSVYLHLLKINKLIWLDFRVKKFPPFLPSLFCTCWWAVPQSDCLMCLLVESWFLLPKTWLLSLSLFHPHPKFDWIFHLTNLKKQKYMFLNRKTTNLFTAQAEHFQNICIQKSKNLFFVLDQW